jgi:hypothetical protein
MTQQQKTYTCQHCHHKGIKVAKVTAEQFQNRICPDCDAKIPALATDLVVHGLNLYLESGEITQAEYDQVISTLPAAPIPQVQPEVQPSVVQEIKMKTIKTKRLWHLVHYYNRLERKLDYQVKRLQQPGEELQSTKMYRLDECSNFLEEHMPCEYIQTTHALTEDGIREAKSLIMRGINQDTIEGYTGEPMYLWYGFVGENIQGIFTPYRVPMEKLGLVIDSNVKIKYPKRVFAPHQHSVSGESKRIGDDLYEFTLRTRKGISKLTALILEATPANDGMSLCTPRAAHLISGDDSWEEGDGLRFTGLFQKMVKGHFLVKEDLVADMIFFGPKKGIAMTDKVWLGYMGELHAARTKRFDFQSIIDFFQHAGGTEKLAEIAETTMEERLKMTEDPEAMRRMLLNMHDLGEDNQWILIDLLKRDIDPVFPGTWRRIAKTFLPEIDKMGIGRIGADQHLSDGYALRFPDSFDREGKDTPERSRVRGNHVFTPQVNLDQQIVLYRQPNGNPQEHWKTQSLAIPQWKNMGRGNVVYFSYEMAIESLAAMGGGDFDDRIMIVKNPALVEIFDRLPEYPLVAKK